MNRIQCAILIVALSAWAGPASAEVIYEVVDLGMGYASGPQGLNEENFTAGRHGTLTPTPRPVAWSPIGGRTMLPTLGGSVGVAMDINDHGLIIGRTSTETRPARNFVATAWESGPSGYSVRALPPLGTFPFSSAMGLNNSGQVVGYSHQETFNAYWTDGHPTSQIRATMWSGADQSIVTDLGIEGESNSVAFAVNDLGHVVGETTKPLQKTRATLWKDGTHQELGALDDGRSYGRDINEFDQVVGYSQTLDRGV